MVVIASDAIPPQNGLSVARAAIGRNKREACALQSSHGFTSSSKWAERIGAFINLESTGSAGVQLLVLLDAECVGRPMTTFECTTSQMAFVRMFLEALLTRMGARASTCHV